MWKNEIVTTNDNLEWWNELLFENNCCFCATELFLFRQTKTNLGKSTKPLQTSFVCSYLKGSAWFAISLWRSTIHSGRYTTQNATMNGPDWVSDGKWMKISKEFCGNACYFVCGNQRAMQEYKHTYFPYGLPVNWIQLLSLCSTIWPSYICWSQKKNQHLFHWNEKWFKKIQHVISIEFGNMFRLEIWYLHEWTGSWGHMICISLLRSS